jgi:hypothetical protein
MADDIQALKDKVVEAAKAVTEGSIREVGSVYDAVAALRAAEEAARKPRLRTADECVGNHWGVSGSLTVSLIEARDAEWIAAVQKVERHTAEISLRGSSVKGECQVVALADILALAPEK